jgi:RNA polymerase sigma-70 factor, ECF subfamily
MESSVTKPRRPAELWEPGRGALAVTPTSLERFIAEHYPRLIRLGVLLCRNTADAEDAVQAALERAWRSRDSLADESKLRPWLDRIVVREAARLLRGRSSLIDLTLAPDRSAPDRGAEQTAVREALASLTVDQRAAVVLHLYAGHTVPATARLLGVPEETVRSRLRVARDRLRTLLGEEQVR